MAGLTTGAKNAMLDQLGTLAGYASLHSADPGNTGASEISGGTPAYARKALTWAAASAASKATSAAVSFDVAGSTTIAYVGLWSAATGGTFYGSFAITSETFGAQGTYTLSSITETLT